MESKTLRQRIFGGLAGAAVGDALGFPAHELTSDEIRRRFNGPLDRMEPPLDDDLIHIGFKAGQVTDDTILTFVTARAILETKGQLTAAEMAKSLTKWASENEELWREGNVFGPSTKKAFTDFMQASEPWQMDKRRNWAHMGTSDGAVMKIAPAGLVNPGRIEEAVALAYEVVAPTHGTQVAVSAAGAQAAAIAHALTEDAEVISVVAAALEGARLGEKIGLNQARVVPAPSVVARIEWAVHLAIQSTDAFEAGERIQRYFGTHLAAAEALPVSIGLFVAAKGDPRIAMVAAATTGGDTDTNASICGALCGALKGIEAIPADWLQLVEDVNHLGIEDTARQLWRLAGE